MKARKLAGACVPLLVAGLLAGCGGSSSPTAPVAPLSTTTVQPPVPAAQRDEGGPGVGTPLPGVGSRDGSVHD